MLVNLRGLNESLERKYGLNEEIELDEAFGDIPKWFKDRLLTTKYYQGGGLHYRNTNLHKSDASIKNPKAGPDPTYSIPRGWENRGKDWSIFGQLREQGFNMENLKVVEVPESEWPSQPSKFKKPTDKWLPVFLLDNGQMYIKGINDNEEFAALNYTAFKYVSFKYLKEHLVNFAYIDVEASGQTANDKKDSRADMKRELDKIPNYNRRPEMAGRETYGGAWDKSGYFITPITVKYEKELKEIKANKLAKTMKEHYVYLTDAKENLASLLLDGDIRYGFKSEGGMSKADDILNFLRRACINYNDVMEQVEKVLFINQYNNPEEKTRAALSILDSYDYRELVRSIDKLKQYAGKEFNSVIDWI